MGMKLDSLTQAQNLSGWDLVPAREELPSGEVKNSYRIEKKSSIFRRTVRVIKYYVSGSYRNSVKEMRCDALRDLEKLTPIADACADDTAGNADVKTEIRTRLDRLQSRGVKSWKFVKEVQNLARFATGDGTAIPAELVFSTSKRNLWTDKSRSLSSGECQRYIRADGWDIKIENTLSGDSKEGIAPRPNLLCGLAALDCMTTVLLSDGVLRPHVENNSEIAPADDAQPVEEKQERVLTAMAFLKFLTIEPHANTNDALFKWSGSKDVGGAANKLKFLYTSFHGMAPPNRISDDVSSFLKILTPEKALQRHVVNLLNEFPYEEGKGLAIDKKELLTTLPAAGGEEELTPRQKKWVASKLFEFLN